MSMAVPKISHVTKPVLTLLSDGAEHTAKEIREYVAGVLNLPQCDIDELLPNGRQTRFSNRIGWACMYLKKAGLAENVARGTFVITDEGANVIRQNPPLIDEAFLMRYDSFRQFLRPTTTGADEAQPGESTNAPDQIDADDDSTPDDALESALDRINRTLIDDLLAEVMRLTPIAFERLVLDLMARMGYGTFENAATMTAATGDEGIDGIIMQDKLGFDLIYVQAKRWGPEHIVGRPEVQAFVGAIAGRSGKGLFVTTSRFTRQAEEYARARHVVLMDGERLARCMMEYNFGVVTRRTLEVKAIDATMFENYQDL